MKGISEKIVQQVIIDLEEKNLLNDRDFIDLPEVIARDGLTLRVARGTPGRRQHAQQYTCQHRSHGWDLPFL